MGTGRATPLWPFTRRWKFILFIKFMENFYRLPEYLLTNYINHPAVLRRMNISIFGSGYVGLVTGACLANLGHTVLCVDVDEQRIENLKKNILPIFEPGLPELVVKNSTEHRLFFTTNAKEAVETADIIFITVGTPQSEYGQADLRFVYDVAETIGKYMNGYKVIVDKSTVPVGTADNVKAIIQKNQISGEKFHFDLVSNPEFLREGEAIYDFMNPDRIVIGVENENAKEIITNLYKGIERTEKPIFITDIKSSEIIKYAANAFLATKISFMNQIAQLCEKAGGDVKEVSKGIGLDQRIGSRFLQAGVGWGGSCFPKDVQALIYTAEKLRVPFQLLRAVHEVNTQQKKSLLPKIEKLAGNLHGKIITVLGLSFKPKTDDIRDAPAHIIIQELLAAGAIVQAFDPVAMENTKKLFPKIQYCQNTYEAAAESECIVIVTEWDEFRYLDLKKIRDVMKQPTIVDGRNIYDPKEVHALGFRYIGVGRNVWQEGSI